jgi:hypothetical protein
LFKGSNDFQR